VGTVLHVARSGRLIIKASSSKQIRDGTLLVDEQGRVAGKVMETIGPVEAPYLSVQPFTDRTQRISGSKLFVSESPMKQGERASSDRGRGRRIFSTRRDNSGPKQVSVQKKKKLHSRQQSRKRER
jgi:rRNA processing protein Gar1